MNKIFTLLLVSIIACGIKAQPPAQIAHGTQPYGKVDMADLEMTSCDFEKDANAEVLFDKGSVSFDSEYNMIFERHARIKIFNDKGKDQADIKLEYAEEIMRNILPEYRLKPSTSAMGNLR